METISQLYFQIQISKILIKQFYQLKELKLWKMNKKKTKMKGIL